jgi:hypothetical protein
MNEINWNAKRLTEIRTMIDSTPLVPSGREAAEGGLQWLRRHWIDKHERAYGDQLGKRDIQHENLRREVARYRSEAPGIADKVSHGRMKLAEANAWLRDALAAHGRLLDEHHAIDASEAVLEQFEAMSPEEYQVDIFDRLPQMEVSAVRFENAVKAHLDESR